MKKNKLFIVGRDGKMGQVLEFEANLSSDFLVVGGLDENTKADNNLDIDVIIDFSRPACLDAIINLIAIKKCPVVIATTGYNSAEIKKIEGLSKTVPVFMSGNMSFGIKVLQQLVSCAAINLASCSDIDIIEKHHNQKVDAPSGTALMLEVAVKQSCENEKNIAMHSIRGGTIVGEHEVNFYSDGEVVTIKHSALSRNIFAKGALKAARFILSQKCGLYNMDDLVIGC